MSESLPKLEIEPEWCSAAVLSSISTANEPCQTQTAEACAVVPEAPTTVKPEITVVASPTPTPEPKMTPGSVKPTRLDSKTKSGAKTTRSKSLPQPTKAMKWIGVLRSRRVRILATAVCVLFVCGLIVLNWKSGSQNSGDEVVDMDLSEFNESPGLEELHTGKNAEPQPLEVVSDAVSIPTTGRFPRTESDPRLPPLGLVTHADHVSQRGNTGSDLVPVSATGSRGAVLTGQIEFDTPQRSAEVPARSFRNLGMR